MRNIVKILVSSLATGVEAGSYTYIAEIGWTGSICSSLLWGIIHTPFCKLDILLFNAKTNAMLTLNAV